MGFWDGFWFWLGKQASELLLVAVVVGACLGWFAVDAVKAWWLRRRSGVP